MAINTKNRSELKAYFVKNAIPTEQNFADFIDAQLNQADDGVFKLGDEPLSVVAAPGEQKRVLRLYEQYPAPNPSWTLSLMPRTDVADAETAAAGLGFDAPDGSNRLFLDASGKLGLGTTSPTDKLTVHGGDLRIEGGRYRRLKIVSDTFWAGIELVARNTDNKGGHPHIDFTHGDLDSPNFGVRLVATDNSNLQIQNGALGVDQGLSVGGGITTKDGLHINGNRGDHINGDGALYRTGGQVWLTVDDNFYIRDAGAGSWAAHFNTNDASLSVKGGLSVGAGDRGGHINDDGALYRKGSEVWMTVDSEFYFRKANAGDNWAVRVNVTDGSIRTKGGINVSGGNRSDHLESDGAFYRKGGQTWLTVDDNLYIRDAGSGDNWAARFMTDQGHLAVTGNFRAKGGTVHIGGWDLVADGEHLYFKKGTQTVARLSTTHDRFQVYRNLNGIGPYFYYNKNGDYGR